MPLSLIQMHKTQANGTNDDIANINIPEDGSIVGVEWTGVLGGAGFADADSMVFQLSFVSTTQITGNDIRGAVSLFGMSAGTMTTSGVAGIVANKWVPFVEPLDVQAGERLHIHSQVAGVCDVDLWCMLHLATRRPAPRRARRRR